MGKAYHARGRDDWGTPPELFNKLDKEFHFTLDVCATYENRKCDRFFPPEMDSLKQEWKGVCFMNPPFSQVKEFVKKAHDESAAGRCTVVALMAARTDTKYFHNWIYKSANEIRFLKGRVKFVGASHGAPFPSMIVIWRRRRFFRFRKAAILGALALGFSGVITWALAAARLPIAAGAAVLAAAGVLAWAIPWPPAARPSGWPGAI